MIGLLEKTENWVRTHKWIYGVGILAGWVIGVAIVNLPYSDYIFISIAVSVILFGSYILIFRKGKWKW